MSLSFCSCGAGLRRHLFPSGAGLRSTLDSRARREFKADGHERSFAHSRGALVTLARQMRTIVKNPRFWLGGATVAFAALIVLPRALRADWPPALTLALAVLACALLAASWMAARQVSVRTGLLLLAAGAAIVAAAAYAWP
jgi:hypothetical protein